MHIMKVGGTTELTGRKGMKTKLLGTKIVRVQLVCMCECAREGRKADGGSLLAANCVQFVNRLTK